jgi:hypothetical protein
MSISKELSEDIPFLKEYLYGDAKKSYTFKGVYGPIIGMHGVYGGWMPDGIRFFMKQNDVSGILVSWGSLTNSLEDYLPKIDAEVMKYNYPILLGYSMGGILALLYTNRYKAWDKIKKIITIASPLAGLNPKLKYVGKSLGEMGPKNPILKEVLNIKPPKNKVFSLFAHKDKFTPNPEVIKLNWPSKILPAESHGDIQNHHKWIDEILKEDLGIT